MALWRVTAYKQVFPIVGKLKLGPCGCLRRSVLQMFVVEGREGGFVEILEIVEEYGGCR